MRSLNTDIATLAAVLSLSFPIAACAAQSAGVAAGAQASAQASAQSNAIIERYMTSVDTELTGKLDSKNAAVGQQVTAKISQTATLADGTMLPKGTRLVGRVTQVQAESRDQPYAALAISFDRAELKNGQSVALRSEIRMVAPPASTVATSSASLMGADQATGMPGAGGMGSRRHGLRQRARRTWARQRRRSWRGRTRRRRDRGRSWPDRRIDGRRHPFPAECGCGHPRRRGRESR